MNHLAGLYHSQEKYEEAEPLFIQALQLTKSILGENHSHYAQSLNNLAGLYHSQGGYEEAEPLFIQALELTKSILGENHPDSEVKQSQGFQQFYIPLVLIIDETGDKKKGKSTDYVKRQYIGNLGKTEKCTSQT